MHFCFKYMQIAHNVFDKCGFLFFFLRLFGRRGTLGWQDSLHNFVISLFLKKSQFYGENVQIKIDSTVAQSVALTTSSILIIKI